MNGCRKLNSWSRTWLIGSAGNSLRRRWSSGLVFLTMLGAVPVLAQPANFGKLELGPNKTSGILTGTTGGSTSLPAIVSNSDRHNRKCLGFGDPTPDHILVLKQGVARLRLKVDSDGTDTTLVVQAADGTVRCGDDSGNNKDASITDTDWQPGSYKVWVGSAVPGVRRDYTLTIQQ